MQHALSDTQLTEFATKFETLLTEWSANAQTAAEVRAAQAEEHIRDLESNLAKAQRLVEMTGEVAMTGHYQRNAEKQKEAADNLRLAAIVTGVGAVVWAIVLTLTGIYKDDPK